MRPNHLIQVLQRKKLDTLPVRVHVANQNNTSYTELAYPIYPSQYMKGTSCFLSLKPTDSLLNHTIQEQYE